jgi:hypothetical protein
VGWEGERDFAGSSFRDRPVEVKENSAGAYVLGFGLEFVVLVQANQCGQAHIKAPHHPPFL